MKLMERGQLTIPKKLRDLYGLRASSELDLIAVKEGILIVKKKPSKSPIEKAYGILKKNISSDDYLDEIRGR
jgi:AbrB family looped-hinge helix DNA binding protein